jgi:hypothetical protein
MYLAGFFTGLYVSGFGVGVYNSIKYSSKIIQESKTQPYPYKFISYYGATVCSISMGVASGFTFIASPIIVPLAICRTPLNKPISHKIDEYDIITFSK